MMAWAVTMAWVIRILCVFLCITGIKSHNKICAIWTNRSDISKLSQGQPYSMASSCIWIPPKHKGHCRRRYSLGLESGGGLVCVCLSRADEEAPGTGAGQEEGCRGVGVAGDAGAGWEEGHLGV